MQLYEKVGQELITIFTSPLIQYTSHDQTMDVSHAKKINMTIYF